MKESASFTLRKDIKAAFAGLTDIDRWAQLSQGRLKVEAVAGRERSGAGAAVLLKTGTPAGDVLCETLEWDPPRRCVRRLAIPDLPTTVWLTLSETQGKTLVTVEVELTPQSLLYKMMLPMLAQKVAGQKDEAVKRLQKELDSAT